MTEAVDKLLQRAISSPAHEYYSAGLSCHYNILYEKSYYLCLESIAVDALREVNTRNNLMRMTRIKHSRSSSIS